MTALTLHSWKTHAQFLLGPEKQKTFSRKLFKKSPRGIPKHIYQDRITQDMQIAALLWLAAVTVRTWNIHTQSLFLPEKQKTFSQLALTCHEGTPKHIHQRTNGYFMFFFYSTPSTEGVESTRGNSVCLSVCLWIYLSVITFSFSIYSIIWCSRRCKPFIFWKLIMLATSIALFWPSTT